MHQLYVLFESATGYALFRTTEFEEVSIFLPQVQKSILDVSKFRSIVFLAAFHPFKTGREAVENFQYVAEGRLHKDLRLFLENNVPKSKKSKQTVVLGVQEPLLAAEIKSSLGISCSTAGPVAEIVRGIRFHFHKMVKGYKDLDGIIKSQQGLGHHYSRKKIHHKFDNMITQSSSALEQLDKDINRLAFRVSEWYSFHFPELIKLVPQPELYVRCVKEIGNRKNMPTDITETLMPILENADKVKEIMEAAHMSMGMDIAEEDVDNIETFINQITSLMKRRSEMTDYLKVKMHQVAPNLATLMGELVGAQLICQAGSLTSLAKYPASTVQILGAEKSLFRTMKTKSKNASKFNSVSKATLIGKSGRISRYLANKCCLASRIDCFSKTSTDVHGQNLKQLVEDRMKFYKIGKYSLVNDPEKAEERKKVLAAKRALIRKKKRQRKHKKLISEELTPAESVVTMNVESMASETPEKALQSPAKQKKSGKTPKKVTKEESMDTQETPVINKNGIEHQPRQLRSRKKAAA